MYTAQKKYDIEKAKSDKLWIIIIKKLSYKYLFFSFKSNVYYKKQLLDFYFYSIFGPLFLQKWGHASNKNCIIQKDI